ncbi:MAG: GGDEF domain-containing protein [Gammaproteobacteria bacterium]
MTIQISVTLISFLGLLSQTAAALMLVCLFLLLRSQARRRGWFIQWTNAWWALLVALFALSVRYVFLPDLLGSSPRENGLAAQLALFVYQCGKLFFFLLTGAGVLSFVRGGTNARHLAIAYSLSAAYALLSVMSSGPLDHLMIWQVPPAVLVCAAGALLLLTLPANRRTLGTRTTGVVLAAMAVLWTLYLGAFAPEWFGWTGPSRPFSLLAHFNSYFDLIPQMLLGFGMVLMLLEDAKKEVDSANRELARAHRQLLTESHKDPLTECANRRAFMEGVGLEAVRHAGGCLVMLDLNRLKRINDTWGHRAGDLALIHLSQVLARGLRPSDRLYRWGGDEFLIILPAARATRALARVREILDRAPALQLPGVSGGIRVTASCGAADFSDIPALDAALARADSAMYRDKRARRPDEGLQT